MNNDGAMARKGLRPPMHSAAAPLLLLILFLFLTCAARADSGVGDDWWFYEIVMTNDSPPPSPLPELAVWPDGAMSVDLAFNEFAEIQRLDLGDRRTRLGLPKDCTPGLTASSSTRGRVLVIVQCHPVK